MLNFISLDPSHTDDILSEVIIKSLTDWAIDRKLFSMTFDDCSAYEVMVFRIKDWLSQNRPLLKNGDLFDVRCVTHLLKSIVQEVMEACRDVTHKIRESVRHVKSSQTVLGKFNEIAQQVGINSGRRLVLDYPMQWNSTYMMLEAAIEYRVPFVFCKSMMHPTQRLYLRWSGNGLVLLQMIFLSSVALKMKLKFDVYWNKCSMVLAIAAILDPRFKMKLVEYYFRQIYGSAASDRIKEVSAGLRELYNEYSMGLSSPDEDSGLPGSCLPSSSNSSRDKLKGFDKFLYETSQSQSMSSDLDKYLEEPVFPRNYDFSILNWWKVHTPRYPILSMMARDVLGIPVSTLGPEVAFSNGGRVLDQYHSSLSPDTREALLCGQDWLRMEPEGTTLTLSNSPLPLPVETS
ncbi:UNVERIFIED_CONTAM: Zinc finger BED domain-containing protein RICESLEEPER 1 [Sesamum latifolium]|uniref:Zinc finger BED domain-containing protein RICESLEEPER 1 n=1 Tax=Sesamum latifolium TaxID=2727402 RepID=A0AAW2TQB2_9LAMI